MRVADEVDRLASSEEPSVRYLVRRDVLGEDPTSRGMMQRAAAVRSSPRVAALIEGHARAGAPTYGKWRGAHWVLLHLAALGHPGGDPRVAELVDEVLSYWTAPRFMEDRAVTPSTTPKGFVPVIDGKARRCGSQQGGALLSAVRLGFDADPRVGVLADRLRDWQWPDGGWNCDRRAAARMSSVNETLLPLRGLAAAQRHPESVASACEVLLERRVVYRRSREEPIHPSVLQLHHPVYWHYDLLAGLVGLVEAGRIDDPRCDDALDLLESYRLPDGGWPAHAKWYRTDGEGAGVDLVSWGPTGGTRPNEWVTLQAVRVLRAAGRG